jgi:hypothetical protein
MPAWKGLLLRSYPNSGKGAHLIVQMVVSREGARRIRAILQPHVSRNSSAPVLPKERALIKATTRH